jgi:trk system potassium uptake protein TrkH
MEIRRPRPNLKLLSQYRAMISYLGLMLGLAGSMMLLPLLVILVWPEEIPYVVHFLVPGLVLMVGGTVVYYRFRQHDIVLTMQDGGLIVLLSWMGACLFSSWPLMAIEDLTFTQAVFEAVSGWTTTGLSVVDVTTATHMTLLWRSTMQLIGGAGFAIIMLIALAGPVGIGLPTAEGRGEQLLPHVRGSARLVFLMYSVYVVVGIGAYRVAGMNWFDAVNHAFAAVSTGGFSTRPESIGDWNSIRIEAVSLPLMFLGNFNFLTAYLLWRGRVKAVWRNGEVRFVAVFLSLWVLLLFLLVCWGLYPNLEKSIRVAVFAAVTCITTTGFSTVTYTNWNAFGILLLIIGMLIGGGVGSTAGGMKQFRILLLCKAIGWEIRRALLPASAVVEPSVWHGEERQYVSDTQLRGVAVFVFLYLLAGVVGTAILTAHGIPLQEAWFEFASAQGTVGLSIGVTRPDAPSLVLWTQTVGMFLGRLEFLIVFEGIVKMWQDLPVLGRSLRS